MNIQWYPGHMTKAKRAMKEDMKLIDLVIELVDARVPLASRNPDLDELGRGKSRIVLLNKGDLADERLNEAWTRYFQEKGFFVLKVNARSGSGLKQLNGVVQEACREKLQRDRKRGILNRPVRAMVVGIPNVGKSTFINSFTGKACTKTGNKPGVTKGNQWIRLNKSLELLDTPGILWPKFEDQRVGLLLAFIGSINDEILHKEELAMELIRFLMEYYPGVLEKRYQIDVREEPAAGNETGAGMTAGNEPEDSNGHGSDQSPTVKKAKVQAASVLTQIAQARGCLMKGKETDTAKAAGILLDDFRSGRLGRITLEFPEADIP